MPFPILDTIPVGELLDLEDERRNKKPWLPQSGNDVSEGWISLVEYPNLTDYWPACKEHGALLCVAIEGHIWRCGEFECGAGAIYRRP